MTSWSINKDLRLEVAKELRDLSNPPQISVVDRITTVAQHLRLPEEYVAQTFWELVRLKYLSPSTPVVPYVGRHRDV